MIYLIYGCDIEFAINKEIKNALKSNIDNIDNFNVTYYDYPSTSLETIVNDCETISFFEEKKAIVVKNCLFINKDTKDTLVLEKYLDNPLDSTVLILVFKGSINDKLSISKKLKEVAKLCKINDIDNKDWPQVISQLLNQFNIQIEDDARKEFINRTSGDLDRVISEISKLRTLDSLVTLDVVKKMVYRPLEDKTFEMVDCLLDKKIDRATQIYNDLKLQNVDPVVLISSLATQFRFLYQVIYLHNKGYSNDEIANELNGVKSARVYFSLKKIGHHNENDILEILNELANLDEQIRYGIIDKNIGFELFLIKER